MFFEGEDNIEFGYEQRQDLGIGLKRKDDSTIDLIGSQQQVQHGFPSESKLPDSDSEDSRPIKTNFESQRASFARKQQVESDIKPAITNDQQDSDSGIKSSKVLNQEEEDSSSSISSPRMSQQIPAADLEKDMKALLKMIEAYRPENFELEPQLQPFTPDYIPCIGDIDPMIKVFLID
jgi:intraflagellar transport protein 46